MRVYRLENNEGRGVFQTGTANAYARASGDNPSNMPKPSEEGLHRTRRHYCGFSDEAQLKRWFPSIAHHPDVFEHHQTELVVFDVDDDHVQVGQTQVIFIKEAATPVKRVPVREYQSCFC